MTSTVTFNLYRDGNSDFSDYLIGLIHRDLGGTVTCSFDRRTSGCDLFELL